MDKKMIYIMDTLAFFILSIISVIIGYDNLTYVEEVENEYNVFYVYTYNVAREYISYLIMFVALGFLLYYIYRVNMELIEQGVIAIILKELLLLVSIVLLIGFYIIAPFIFMVELPNQVIFSSVFSSILKYLIEILPFVFYLMMMLVMIIKKIKGDIYE